MGRHGYVGPIHRIAGLVLLVLLGLPVCVVASPAPALAAKPPAEWDRRVVALAEEVERLRGLEFTRPVPVKVLDSAAFDRRFTREQVPTARARAQWAESEAALRALGLLDQAVDLETLTAGVGAQVLGFYDPERERIVVRGDDLSSPATRATLAHELTHVLQDQQFDLDKLRRRERRSDTSSVSALIEGDATRVGEAYTSGLSAPERAEAAAADASTVANAPDIPPVVTVMLSAPYSLGFVMTTALQAAGGDGAVDAAFRDPPMNDLAIIDPVALLERTKPAPVEPPALEPGDEPLGDPTVMGATLVYFVLASHLPPADALAIAERWGGDSSTAFTRDGSTACVASVLVGRHGTADTRALAGGLERWNDAAGADAVITRRGDDVALTACAPSAPGVVSEAALSRAFFYVLLRNSFVAALLNGVDVRIATCVADGLMALEPVQRALAAVDTPDDDIPEDLEGPIAAAVQANAARLRSQCSNVR